MEPTLSDIQCLKVPRKRRLIHLGLPDMHPTVVAYFCGFVTEKSFNLLPTDRDGINEIRIEGGQGIPGQFEHQPPQIAEFGFIQVAFSYYAQRFVLDIKTGEVMVCRSPMLSHELYEWDKAGRSKDVGSAVGRCADDTFDNLAIMFWCFENMREDDDDEDETKDEAASN